jgi:erythronate-4-phosphate dehydrogenase
MKIIADDKIPFLRGVLEPFADVEYIPGAKISPEQVKGADALIIRTRTQCNEKLLAGSKVKMIATATIGFDHIDTVYCDRNGIKWTNAPGCNSTSVQQYVATALGHLAQKHNIDLKERTLGIVGVGHVGKKVLRMAEDLGLRIVLNDPPRMRNEGGCGFVSIETLLREADILTFHVPLNTEGNDKTYHLADDVFFEKVNPGAFIINSSRGEVVDTQALKRAIQSGKIQGAVIDVWENEPDIDLELMGMADLATPHIAGYSLDGKANGTAMSVNAICSFFGFPFKDWEPCEIPHVANNILKMDGKGKPPARVLLEAVCKTYDIVNDHNTLTGNPGTFEKQRGEYPIRREYRAYSIQLEGGSTETGQLLAKYGFLVI